MLAEAGRGGRKPCGKEVVVGVYGSRDQPGKSCKDIFEHGKKENGIYHITFAGVC